ncbi:MAG: hypothetical protein JWL70_1598 [Acidimicrobiia bacterium]|nr:hypothetical protein [Acidimicrobiia bacterium]
MTSSRPGFTVVRAIGTLVAVAALTLGACGGDDKSAAPTSAAPTSAADTTVDPAATTSGPTGPLSTIDLEGQPDTVAPGVTRAPTTRSTATTTTPSPTTMPPPKIVSVSIPTFVNCPTNAVQTITISWTTTGAAKVAISIDSPTGYFQQNLNPNGKLDVPFPCDNTSQTYFVVADNSAGGRTVTERTVRPSPGAIKK